MSPHIPQVQIITPNDEDQTPRYPTTSVFLAGPTEIDWRTTFFGTLRRQLSTDVNETGAPHTHPYPGITLYNPFQPKWNKDWDETSLADHRFRTQVGWELERQEKATVIAVYFHGRSQSPITLLELGLCARSGKAVVGCDGDYWKRGYVQAVCQAYDVPMADSVDGLVALVTDKLKGMKA